jgi:hypothetical protein
MAELLTNSLSNLSSPMILFFILGFIATIIKSDLVIPEVIAKILAIYFMMAIGFKGGVEISKTGLNNGVLYAGFISICIGVLTPIIAFLILKYVGKFDSVNSGAIAAHYGSVSVVTFVTAISFLQSLNVTFSGYMVGMMALMESPAIFISILLVRLFDSSRVVKLKSNYQELIRESIFNASIVLLFGSMIIGYLSGVEGMLMMKPFFVDPFNGILTLFLLEMGMIAGNRISEFKVVGKFLFAFGIIMPVISALIAVIITYLFGLNVGDRLLFSVLSASASYIAAPAAVRLALPKANPSYYITLSLAITFPFNIIVGIPFYYYLCNLIG